MATNNAINLHATGITVYNGTGTFTAVSLLGGTTGLSFTNANGVSGSPTLTGTLVLANGGTNNALTAVNGAVVYSNATQLALTAAGSTGQILQSAGAASPTWSTATYPATTTANQLLYSSATNTVTGLATANSAVLITSSTGVPSFSASLTNGQLIIGSTGAAPTPSTLTAGTGISITNGAGSITIAATSGGLTWTNVVGTTLTMVANNGYLANNASLVTLTLPMTAVQFSIIQVVGNGAGGWTIAQNAGQTINFGNATTTAGAGGSISSTNQFDSIELLCVATNNVFTVIGSDGNMTVV